MPKYFDGQRSLPFPTATVSLSDFSEKWLAREIESKRGKVSLSLLFEGFPKDSLGYVFNIQKDGSQMRVSDITGKQLLNVSTLTELTAMILHAVGARYDAEWQTVFQKVRNQISSAED
jgi:hypothetical protein